MSERLFIVLSVKIDIRVVASVRAAARVWTVRGNRHCGGVWRKLGYLQSIYHQFLAAMASRRTAASLVVQTTITGFEAHL